jgi:hypothetical protein
VWASSCGSGRLRNTMTRTPTAQRLAETLGRSPDEYRALAALPEAQRDHLHACLLATQARQSSALATAMEASLAHVPALLRGAVKRALGIRG